MRIGIDARFYGPVGKGLGRYAQEIVDNIIKMINLDQSSVVVFLSVENYDKFKINHKNVKKVLLKMRWYSWREQILMPWFIWREKLDLLHYPHFNVPIFTPCKFVVTIHDLILTHFPTLRATTLSPFIYNIKNLAYRLVIKQAIKKSEKIITVSEFTKQDILNKFSVAADKIIVTYEGVANLQAGADHLFIDENNTVDILEKYQIKTGQFLLYVGNAYPHKNLDFLLRSFSELKKIKNDLRLVFVGRADYFYQKLQHEAANLNLWQADNIASPVVFVGYVPDKELSSLYKKATLYVFPSFYEGFGLPPLEAMAHACPVISSNQASLPEILGSAAQYFDPRNYQDFIKSVLLVMDNSEFRQELVERGLKQVQKYSWHNCARQTLDIYKQVLERYD